MKKWIGFEIRCLLVAHLDGGHLHLWPQHKNLKIIKFSNIYVKFLFFWICIKRNLFESKKFLRISSFHS